MTDNAKLESKQDHTDLSSTRISSGSTSLELTEGAAVESRHGGQTKWYSGVVDQVNGDGSYAVLYDDGDKEPEVRRYRIRCKGDEAGSDYECNEEVDVRYGGGNHLYAGKIAKVHDDGTYDIKYADGDKEQAVAKEMVFGRFRSGGGLLISTRQVGREGEGSGEGGAAIVACSKVEQQREVKPQLLHARQATDEQKRQTEAEVVKGRQQLAEQKAANEAEARKESERLLANVASDARQKVADAIKQLAEGATSLE
jgi:hypothetical protein